MSISNTQDAVERTRAIAQKAIHTIHPNALAQIMDHIHVLHLHELSLCSTQYDETKLRQSQGAAKAYATLHSLLAHEHVEQRRTTSRHEV